MSVATKLKEHLLTAAMAVFGAAALYSAMRAREFGISGWLAGVLGLTIFLCFVLAVTFRTLDPFRKRASLLLVGGLALLSGAGLVNEFLTAFFTPSRMHLFIALIPSVGYAGYRAYKDRANAQS